MVSPNVQFILLFLIIFFSSQFLSEDHNTCAFVIDTWWFAAQMLNLGRVTRPTALSSHVAAHSAIIFSLLSVPLCLLVQGTAWHQKVIFTLHMFFLTSFSFNVPDP
jgi:hypothetical protein